MIGFGQIMRSIAVWGLLVPITTGGIDSQRPALAQGGQCTQSCHAAYAQCYKDSGSNRKVCEAQLQQCLAGCINKR